MLTQEQLDALLEGSVNDLEKQETANAEQHLKDAQKEHVREHTPLTAKKLKNAKENVTIEKQQDAQEAAIPAPAPQTNPPMRNMPATGTYPAKGLPTRIAAKPKPAAATAITPPAETADEFEALPQMATQEKTPVSKKKWAPTALRAAGGLVAQLGSIGQMGRKETGPTVMNSIGSALEGAGHDMEIRQYADPRTGELTQQTKDLLEGLNLTNLSPGMKAQIVLTLLRQQQEALRARAYGYGFDHR